MRHSKYTLKRQFQVHCEEQIGWELTETPGDEAASEAEMPGFGSGFYLLTLSF